MDATAETIQGRRHHMIPFTIGIFTGVFLGFIISGFIAMGKDDDEPWE